MKLTKETLKQIIKEEIQAVLNEEEDPKHRVVFKNGKARPGDIRRATNHVITRLEQQGSGRITPRDRKTVMNAITGQKGSVELVDFSRKEIFLSQYLEYVNK